MENLSIFEAFQSPRRKHFDRLSPITLSPSLLNKLNQVDAADDEVRGSTKRFMNLGDNLQETTMVNSRSRREALDRVVSPLIIHPKMIMPFDLESDSRGQNSSKKNWLDSEIDDFDFLHDDSANHGSKKQNKGLKLLSIVVKDIVIVKKWTSYKEVAEIILNDSVNIEEAFLPRPKLSNITREEQNIKRRVYDALNVLISAGVLLKEGKRVKKNKSNKLIILSQLQYKINYKKVLLEEKRRRMNEVRSDIATLRLLLQRNRPEGCRPYMTFPLLLVVPVKGEDAGLEIRMQDDLKKLQVVSRERLKIITDSNLLSILRSDIEARLQ